MNTPIAIPQAQAAFGVDDNAGAPLIVKATGRGSRLTFTRATRDDLSAPPARTVVAACLLQRESFIRWLTAPIASPQKAQTVFHALLDVQLPFSIEECEVTLLAMSPTADRTGTNGLVAGARDTDITKRLATLSALGAQPHILDQEAIALWSRALDEAPPEPAFSIRVIVYAGADRVTVVLGKDRNFITALTMRQWDPEAVHRALKSAFPVPPEATRWLWTGPGALDEGKVSTQHATLASRWPGSLKEVAEPELFLARALAARALTPGKDRCNLRTGRFLHPMLARWNARQPYRLASACLVAGILLCLVNLTWQAAIGYRLTQAQRSLREQAIKITGSPRGIQGGQELLSARRAFDIQTREMEPFLVASDQPVQSALNTILASAREEGVSIETMTIGLNNGVIHGLAAKLAQGEKMASRLNGAGWITTIERKDAAPGEERVAFVIGLGHSHGKK